MAPLADIPQPSASYLTPNFTSRPLFPQAPTFTIDDFSRQDFVVKDFIESMTDEAIPPNRRSGPAGQPAMFDPRPLIRTFEHALSRLSELSADHESRETELAGAVKKAEARHAANVQSLGGKLEETVEAFRKLDTSLSGSGDGGLDGAGHGAVKIGEELEELDRQRRRLLEASLLIRCWLDVSERGSLFMLEDMRREASGERRVRCAQIARQLVKISQRLDPGSWSQSNGQGNPIVAKAINGSNGLDGSRKHQYNTREIIEKFSETLEKDLLAQFDEFYSKSNFDGMRECTAVLQDFGGGASVIGAFVNQHPFFIDRSQLITEEVGGDAETWDRLADPDADTPGIEPSLQSLVDEVKVVVQEESGMIKLAFSYYEIVLARFLQRIFQQSIQQRLEMVLAKASAISTLAFLRSLQAARSYICALVDDLKAHGLTEHPEALASSTALVLDQQFDDLFVPYFVVSSYIEREKRNLEELYSSLLFKFTVLHSRRRKIPTTFLASLAKSGSEMLATAKDAYIERLDSSDLSPQQRAMLLRVAGLKDTDTAKRQTETELREEDGRLSTINAKRMLKWLAEAVGRGLELSGGNETPKDVSALLDILLTHMGELYIETALDAANDAAAAQENAKTEPDLSFLETLHPAITMIHLMATSVNTVLIPLAASHTTVRREMEKRRTSAMNRMEDKINGILQRTIDVVISWVTRLLAGQKKTDFRPKEDHTGSGSSWVNLLQTPTCLSISKFLTNLHNYSTNALTASPSLTTFLTEIALSIRHLLLEHFRKFQVSASGGLMVTKDISKYNELFRSWELDEEFNQSLHVLTEIGNLFVIGTEALRERLRAKASKVGGGGLWDREEMKTYVMKRDDATSVGVQFALSAP